MVIKETSSRIILIEKQQTPLIQPSALRLRAERQRRSTATTMDQIDAEIEHLEDSCISAHKDQPPFHQSRSKNKVTFSHVYIETYTVRPCYRPPTKSISITANRNTKSNKSTSATPESGPGLTIDRVLTSKGPFNIDLYEYSRASSRRKGKELKLNGLGRETFFKECGYSRRELEYILAEDKKFYKETMLELTKNTSSCCGIVSEPMKALSSAVYSCFEGSSSRKKKHGVQSLGRNKSSIS